MAKKKKLRIVDLDKLSAGMRVTANAIRAKGNTTGAIEWDYTNGTGFANAVRNIPLDGGVPILTRAEWDELTTEQKQAYGYVGIVEGSEGFIRGKLAYGGDFVPIGEYLPYSDPYKIICEATTDNFTSGVMTWGNGDRPITFNDKMPVFDSSTNSVFIRTYSNGEIGYVDLGAVDTTFTAYLVAKTAHQGDFTRILSAAARHSGGQAPMLYADRNWNVTLSKWLDGVTLGAKSNTWFVAALKCTGANSPYEGAAFDGTNLLEIKSTGNPEAVGRYLTLARTDIGSDKDQEPNDMYVRYLGVTTAADTDETIIENLNYLYQTLCANG